MPATQLRLGPADHGRELTYPEFLAADYKTGVGKRYELIDGRLSVVRWWTPAEAFAGDVVMGQLILGPARWRDGMSALFKSLVPILGQPTPSALEPDFAVYPHIPIRERFQKREWTDMQPLLVAEALGRPARHPNRRRRAELYRAVPSIQEFWTIDSRHDPHRPRLVVRRRTVDGWKRTVVPNGGEYQTPVLPDFVLRMTDLDGGPPP